MAHHTLRSRCYYNNCQNKFSSFSPPHKIFMRLKLALLNLFITCQRTGTTTTTGIFIFLFFFAHVQIAKMYLRDTFHLFCFAIFPLEQVNTDNKLGSVVLHERCGSARKMKTIIQNRIGRCPLTVSFIYFSLSMSTKGTLSLTHTSPLTFQGFTTKQRKQ